MKRMKLLSLFLALTVILTCMPMMPEAKATVDENRANESVPVLPGFEESDAIIPQMPEGENLAMECKASANCFSDIYMASFATDGITKGGSYWNGDFSKEPINTICVDLGEKKSFDTVCLKLPESTLWNKRTQTLSVEASNDGENWSELVSEKDYTFDPQSGNFVVIPFKSVEYQYVQLSFTANTQGSGAQLAEFEIYSLYLDKESETDLMVTSVSANTSNIYDGDRISLIATVRNIGDTDVTDSMSIDFYIDGKLIQAVDYYDTLSSGDRINIQTTVKNKVSFGSHRIAAIINESKVYDDTDTSNNIKKQRITVSTEVNPNQPEQPTDDSQTLIENDSATLILYDGPKTLPSKAEALAKIDPELEKYKKTLARDEDTKIYVEDEELFVYATGVAEGHTWSTNFTAPQMYTPVTYFDAEFKDGGEVTLCVDVTDVAEIERLDSVEILPSSHGITPVIEDKKVYFNIKETGDYSVVFNGERINATHIFVNDIEDYSDYIDDNTVIIEPGEWRVDDGITLETGKSYYLKGGAVLHGNFYGYYVEDVKVFGHGIVDGSWYAGWQENYASGAHVPFNIVSSKNITLDGPTFLNSNCWAINTTDCNNCEFKNIKVITGRANGDGITLQSSQDITVSDSFVRSWGSSLTVKNYTTTQNSKNINFNNILVWTDYNQSMEIGYETNKSKKDDPEISEVHFTDITVLYNFHKPVIGIHNSDDALVHDITYKNIVVEHANMGEGDADENRQLIDLSVESNKFSQVRERGRVKGVTIENVKVLNSNNSNVTSKIVGYDDEHLVEDVTIKDLVILGKKITAENCQDAENAFEFNEFVNNIVFE